MIGAVLLLLFTFTSLPTSGHAQQVTPEQLRMLQQLPPSESLRLWGTVIAAVRQSLPGIDPAAHLLALRSLQTSLIVAGRAPLSADDLAVTREFSAELQFDPIWLPDIKPDEANRYSIVPGAAYYGTFAALLAVADPAEFYAAYPYAIAPPTDNYPYQNVISSLLYI